MLPYNQLDIVLTSPTHTISQQTLSTFCTQYLIIYLYTFFLCCVTNRFSLQCIMYLYLLQDLNDYCYAFPLLAHLPMLRVEMKRLYSQGTSSIPSELIAQESTITHYSVPSVHCQVSPHRN